MIRRGWWGEGWAWPLTIALFLVWWIPHDGMTYESFYVHGGFYLTWGSLTWMMLDYGPTTLPSWGEGWLWPRSLKEDIATSTLASDVAVHEQHDDDPREEGP